MQKTEILLRFLRYTTGFSAICWDGTAEMLEEVEKKHCFSRQAQPLLTAKGLRTALEKIKPGILYEVEDLLGLHFYFFLFQGKAVLVGPFVTAEWSEDSIAEKKRLVESGLPASYLLPYKLYYGIVFALIFVICRSIWPCIILHTLHDFCSFISADGTATEDIVVGAIQFVILLCYGFVLIKRRRK